MNFSLPPSCAHTSLLATAREEAITVFVCIKGSISDNNLLISNILLKINQNNMSNYENQYEWLLIQKSLEEHIASHCTDVGPCFTTAGFIQINRWERKQWRPAPRHSNVRRSKVAAVFRLSSSGCGRGRQVWLGPLCIHFTLRAACSGSSHYSTLYSTSAFCICPIWRLWLANFVKMNACPNVLDRGQ